MRWRIGWVGLLLLGCTVGEPSASVPHCELLGSCPVTEHRCETEAEAFTVFDPYRFLSDDVPETMEVLEARRGRLVLADGADVLPFDVPGFDFAEGMSAGERVEVRRLQSQLVGLRFDGQDTSLLWLVHASGAYPNGARVERGPIACSYVNDWPVSDPRTLRFFGTTVIDAEGGRHDLGAGEVAEIDGWQMAGVGLQSIPEVDAGRPSHAIWRMLAMGPRP